MLETDSLNGSPACSASVKTQETRAASEVLSTENIFVRTRAPANDALLHGQVHLCRSCDCETTSGNGICPACAEALREERSAEQARLCRVHRVRYVEDLPVSVLEKMQAEWGRC